LSPPIIYFEPLKKVGKKKNKYVNEVRNEQKGGKGLRKLGRGDGGICNLSLSRGLIYSFRLQGEGGEKAPRDFGRGRKKRPGKNTKLGRGRKKERLEGEELGGGKRHLDGISNLLN